MLCTLCMYFVMHNCNVLFELVSLLLLFQIFQIKNILKIHLLNISIHVYRKNNKYVLSIFFLSIFQFFLVNVVNEIGIRNEKTFIKSNNQRKKRIHDSTRNSLEMTVLVYPTFSLSVFICFQIEFIIS